MKKPLLFLLRKYRLYFSPDVGILHRRMPTCVFYPTCSVYTEEAIMKYGAMKGVYLSFHRVIRCHPWQKKHIDMLQ
jgi:putative membrane protein insertion efficiency factor